MLHETSCTEKMVWGTQCITKLQAGETCQLEIPNDFLAILSTKESFLPNQNLGFLA
jgi:hypothetical protein